MSTQHEMPTPQGPAEAYGPTAQTASSSSSAPAAQPAQHFATGIDESVNDAKVETEKAFAEADRQAAMKAESIQRQIAANLGPSAGTADASYITRLAADASKGRERFTKGYGPAKVEPAPREGMDKTHREQMGKMFHSLAEKRRKLKPTTASPSPPLLDASVTLLDPSITPAPTRWKNLSVFHMKAERPR